MLRFRRRSGCILTVPAASGHFMCELCAQSVGFSKARNDTGTRYFYHSSGEQQKECLDRQEQSDKWSSQGLTALNQHTMPIRLSLKERTFSLELGFFCPQEDDFRCDTIRIRCDYDIVFEFSFARVEPGGMTYFDLGSLPSKQYRIEYVNGSTRLRKLWSETAPGIQKSGTLFDGRTGQILQPGGKTYPDNTYYLLQKWPFQSYNPDIEVQELVRTQARGSSVWYVYKVCTKGFSEDAAKFFLRYYVFLTAKPTKFYPIWPPYIRSPYLIYHNSSLLYLFLNDKKAEIKSFPAMTCQPTVVQEGQLCRLFTKSKEQLVSVGQSGALGFAYLIQQVIHRQAQKPSIQITDLIGNFLEEDQYTKPPRGECISARCPFDGKAVVKKKGKVLFVYKIIGGQEIIIDQLSSGMDISFYQGQDLVRTLIFNRKPSHNGFFPSEGKLIDRLKKCGGPMVPVPHSAAAVVRKLTRYPQTRNWLRKVLKQGRMPREALRLLESVARSME